MHDRSYRRGRRRRTPAGESLAIRSKVWFVMDEGHAFGAGLASLLALVHRHGTLSQAARSAGMSYRYAWSLIKNAEKHLGAPMTRTQPGGVGGGRTELSPGGRRILEGFEKLSQEVTAFAETRFQRWLGEHPAQASSEDP